MLENKENIRPSLLSAGCRLVEEKGAEYLTARKLSEASGYSVGTIYNQFANMDEFICALNLETLRELQKRMEPIKTSTLGRMLLLRLSSPMQTAGSCCIIFI